MRSDVLDPPELRPRPRVLRGECQRLGRQRTARAARANHRASEEGRLDHRDEQRGYRARRVGDQTSETLTAPASVVVLEAEPLRCARVTPVLGDRSIERIGPLERACQIQAHPRVSRVAL
jgi:hypothetical protein